MRVIVVGGGVMGLCAAWALARAGNVVVLYEQGPLPNPLGSSVDRHRMIRHAYGNAVGYSAMVDSAFAAWSTLWGDLQRRHYLETGTLALDRGDGTFAADSAASFDELKIPYRILSNSELRSDYPLLNTEDVTLALTTDAGGLLWAEEIVGALAEYLPRCGVSVNANTRVAEVDLLSRRVTLEGRARDEADAIVVAAGPWVLRLLPQLAGLVTPSRQIAAYLEPPIEHALAWKTMPAVIDFGVLEGAYSGCYMAPPRHGIGLKVGTHGFSLSGDPNDDRTVGTEETEHLLSECRRSLTTPEDYRITEANTCFYTVEGQERFVVEAVGPSSWVMSGFSGHGFKFGALMGLAVAAALSGRRDPDRISRWAAGDETERVSIDELMV